MILNYFKCPSQLSNVVMNIANAFNINLKMIARRGVRWWYTILSYFRCPSQLGNVVMNIANPFNINFQKAILQKFHITCGQLFQNCLVIRSFYTKLVFKDVHHVDAFLKLMDGQITFGIPFWYFARRHFYVFCYFHCYD